MMGMHMRTRGPTRTLAALAEPPRQQRACTAAAQRAESGYAQRAACFSSGKQRPRLLCGQLHRCHPPPEHLAALPSMTWCSNIDSHGPMAAASDLGTAAVQPRQHSTHRRLQAGSQQARKPNHT